MNHEIHASVSVTMPDEPVAMAQRLAKVAEAWGAFVQAIRLSDADGVVPQFSVNEVRAKVQRKPRKPRLVPVNPPEAA